MSLSQKGNDPIVKFSYTGHGLPEEGGLVINLKNNIWITPEEMTSNDKFDIANNKEKIEVGNAIRTAFADNVNITLNACNQGKFLDKWLSFFGKKATGKGYRTFVRPIGSYSWEIVFSAPSQYFLGVSKKQRKTKIKE